MLAVRDAAKTMAHDTFRPFIIFNQFAANNDRGRMFHIQLEWKVRCNRNGLHSLSEAPADGGDHYAVWRYSVAASSMPNYVGENRVICDPNTASETKPNRDMGRITTRGATEYTEEKREDYSKGKAQEHAPSQHPAPVRPPLPQHLLTLAQMRCPVVPVPHAAARRATRFSASSSIAAIRTATPISTCS